MARRLRTNPQIDSFIQAVLGQAMHHGGNVAHVILPLSNAVRARLNLQVDRVDVYERNGNLARTCWVTVNGNRYAFSYGYGASVIELRQGSIQGPVIFQFDNSTSAGAIAQQAAAL